MTQVADFVRQAAGQCLDLDGAYGCQCVDLADAWANALGYPLPLVAGAKDFAGQAPRGWSWIPNDPSNTPQPGDLVVWDARIGPYGHVALCTGPSDLQFFTSLDQNWVNSGPNGSPAVHVTHNYFGVAGWLRPTTPGGIPLPATPFYVNTHADARWFDHPDQQDMGSAGGLTNLRIVEVANDGASDWYRWDGGAWWIVNTQCDVIAAPPPPSPPTSDLEARVRHLEARLDGAAAELNK